METRQGWLKPVCEKPIVSSLLGAADEIGPSSSGRTSVKGSLA